MPTCPRPAPLPLHLASQVFLSMADKYKPDIVAVARDLGNLGFGLVATSECCRRCWAARPGGGPLRAVHACDGLSLSFRLPGTSFG